MSDLLTAILPNSKFASLERTLKHSAVGYLLADEYGMIEFINDEAARILGFESAEDARGQSLHDLEAVMNCGFAELFPRILQGESFEKKEHRCTNRIGHFACLNIRCQPYRVESGEVIGIFGMLQDVTDLFQMTSKLTEANYVLSVVSQVSEALASAAKLEDVLRIILTGVTANQGLGFNRAFLFLINEQENCLEGRFAVGPDNAEEAHNIWSQLAGRHRTLLELLEDYQENEKISAHPISEKVCSLKVSLDNQSVFTEALESGSGINLIRENNLTGHSLEIMNHLQTDNLAVAPIIGKGRKLGIIAADNKITGKRITDTRVSLLQIFANNSAVAIDHARLYDDILERANELERINQQLADSQEQIIRAEKMSVIGELTSSIAHELRNPLMVIGGFANLMLSSGESSAHSEYLNIILTETQRSESVLHQVLDFSRASRTKSDEIDFNALFREAYDYYRTKTKFRQKGIKVNLTDRPLIVWGNPDQLMHALLQFIYLTDEGLIDGCQATFITERNDNTTKLVIEFDGSLKGRENVRGILKGIFGKSNGAQRLSLIVAGETIKYHGGNYGVENSNENNPKLYIELPCVKESRND